MARPRLIIGNWKMNPSTLMEAKKIARRTKRAAEQLTNSEIIICPPLPFILGCVPKKEARNFHVGAQTISTRNGGGPYTGEVGALMIRDIGAEYVIVGHSESRSSGDTDKVVSERLVATLNAGLVPILCVGESVHDEGGAYLEELKNQIKNSLADVPKKFAGKIIIAYEPVWAIGAQEPMAAEQIYETSLFVKKAFADIFGSDNGLRVRVLYGGAVNFRNAFEIITVGKVDGLLVGRESVNTPGFIELVRSVDKVQR